MDLKGKIAVVTGGSRGIGRAVVRKLNCLGATVIFNYLSNTAAAEETVKSCSNNTVKVISHRCDVSNVEDVRIFFKSILDEFEKVDIVVNNAGINRDNLLMRMKDEEWRKVIEVNLTSSFLVTREVIKTMMRKKFGRLIYISSVVGIRGNAGQANYAASKGGIIAFAKSIAQEYAGRNITANVVAPGFIETEMTNKLPESVRTKYLASIPMKRYGKGEDVANLVAFLASEEAAYITGQVISVDGGLAM
ncbi:MAG: 3-oxoacyl-[acyl-carrier-protein] reductase [Thermotoga sp.]|nr:MAG: 3-oxoacyl-[acyl-carrier-protein] reductase [Thermotoga sp.]